MRPLCILISVIGFILLLPTQKIVGQQRDRNHLHPITRDTFNTFVDNLSAKGQIMAYSTLYPQCGVICGCGTLKIELAPGHETYPYRYVYVAFTCFDGITKKSLNKLLDLDLKKIPLNDSSCFWNEAPVNCFDTQGLPFYEFATRPEPKSEEDDDLK